MKSILQTYVDQEIWLLMRDKWFFATIIRVSDELLWFKHRTHNKETEEDTLWERVVKISEVVAIDKVISVISRKPDVFMSKLLEVDNHINNHQQEHEK
ncbi:hypothetical protein [Trichormus azollae]|jgi:hypothetical protein|uniref:Uncharacterized protein n=1 Tax=Nostoc azollae (strain 0708) TaxID=551115 RepID=D7DZS4_NOSA0|nr:hypothetical protein [Trichormus azollae]ADI64556.1 conserved hypothetical protein ['Nostoc azollae' 0708]